MACWRVLELSQQPGGVEVPQLLVKPDFKSDSYIVHLTCLSNIWSEELSIDDIVRRASHEQSPIEISKQDTTQLAILLENVEKSLAKSGEAVCRIVRADDDGVTIYTSVALPAPLDTLTWKFNLKKRNSTTLKNELILPLLLSSHIQHERMGRLLATIKDKDKAITRLVDQFESSNLDLAAAFPIISGLRSGRKAVKREQAAKHVPALQPFREDDFKNATSSVEGSDVTTLGLFQEALSECTPDVPEQLRSEDDTLTWWQQLPKRLGQMQAAKSRPVAKKEEPAETEVASSDDESGDETEDEFETHENFKSRRVVRYTTAPPQPSPEKIKDDSDVTADTEDDDDLDAPVSQKSIKATKSAIAEAEAASPPSTKSKSSGFRIGGRPKTTTTTSPPHGELEADAKQNKLPVRPQFPSPTAAVIDLSPRKIKKGFKIGGKGKLSATRSSQPVEAQNRINHDNHIEESTSAMPTSSPPASTVEEEMPAEELSREETAEEKAERRRAELKRKTDEAAKKQAQQKKKRRF